MFGIFETIAINESGRSSGSPFTALLRNGYQLSTGLAIGILTGLLMYFFRKCSLWIKAILCLIFVFGVSIGSELIHFHETKYLACVAFGYVCYRVWGKGKPEECLAKVWYLFMPFLFGSIGAAVQVN